MKGYGQFCPVAVACEVFAQRWTPLILREFFNGCRHFNAIHRGLPLLSRTLLSTRLRQLENAGVLVSVPASAGKGREYRLTDAGEEFKNVIENLGEWGQRWTVRVDRENLDAGFLMWNLQRRLALDRLPAHRVVIRFDFHGLPRKHRGAHVHWLILERTEVELCLTDPGFEPDLYVSADLGAFVRVWLGDTSFSAAAKAGEIQLTGSRELVRAFPAWLLFSHFAEVSRPSDKLPVTRHAPDRSRASTSPARTNTNKQRIATRARKHDVTGSGSGV